MYCWEIDPDSNYKVLDRRLVYDTIAAGLPIRPGSSPKVDMCKLLAHSGNTQYIVHRVSIRAFNFPYVGNDGTVLKDIPLASQEEKDVCAIYYAKVTYKESYPSPWEFKRT